MLENTGQKTILKTQMIEKPNPTQKSKKCKTQQNKKNYPCLVTVNGKQGELILQCTE